MVTTAAARGNDDDTSIFVVEPSATFAASLASPSVASATSAVAESLSADQASALGPSVSADPSAAVSTDASREYGESLPPASALVPGDELLQPIMTNAATWADMSPLCNDNDAKPLTVSKA